jgi:hypothetical protein
VACDSPQFSALTAGNVLRALVVSVLAFVNTVGLPIPAATIAIFAAAAAFPLAQVLPWLAVGLATGPSFLRQLLR